MDAAQEDALFKLALTRPAAERATFLLAVCGADAGLRQRLEALLTAHEQPTDVQTEPARPTTALKFTAEPMDETVGQMLGRYKLMESVGEGGGGVVYVAEQTELVRRRDGKRAETLPRLVLG